MSCALRVLRALRAGCALFAPRETGSRGQRARRPTGPGASQLWPLMACKVSAFTRHAKSSKRSSLGLLWWS
eukprot:15433521-Alexandrium_andersonii.AAC.1